VQDQSRLTGDEDVDDLARPRQGRRHLVALRRLDYGPVQGSRSTSTRPARFIRPLMLNAQFFIAERRKSMRTMSDVTTRQEMVRFCPPFFLCCLPTAAETVIWRSTSTGADPPNDRVSCSTTSSVNLGSALTCSTIWRAV
jgi:hypothetical protein